MHIIRAGLTCSALALAANLVFGYLRSLQSLPAESTQPVAYWLQILYYPLAALLGGALAATWLVVRRPSGRGRVTLGDGAVLGVLVGITTGGLLFVWQLLFVIVVNLLFNQAGLFVIGPVHAPQNSDQFIVGTILLLLYTTVYSSAEWLAATMGGVLAGCIAALLYNVYPRRLKG